MWPWKMVVIAFLSIFTILLLKVQSYEKESDEIFAIYTHFLTYQVTRECTYRYSTGNELILVAKLHTGIIRLILYIVKNA